MKKTPKTSLVFLVICFFLVTQNAQGIFQVETGQKVAFQITAASHDITVSSVSETFSGCVNGGTIISNGSVIVVEVGNITATELKWKTNNLSPQLEGTCPSDVNAGDLSFLLYVLYFFQNELNIQEVFDTGVIDPVYFAPFEVPLFVDTKPVNWLVFEGWVALLETGIGSTFSSVDATYSAVNNKMTFSLWYIISSNVDPSTQLTMEYTSSFSYNMTTGILLEAETHFTYNGLYNGVSIIGSSDYKIEQTDVPSNPFNFLEFLKEYMWYFIGGCGVLVFVIILIKIKKK